MRTRPLLLVLLGGMAIVGCALAACVGDDPDPSVGGGGNDGGVDGTSSTNDSATSDTGTANDAQTDGGLGPPPPATGDVKWAAQFGDAGSEYMSAVTFDSKGDMIVCGRFVGTIHVGCAAPLVSPDTTYPDVAVVKYDATGKCVWAQRIGGNAPDYVSACVAGKSDEIYVGGQTSSASWNVGTGASIPGGTGASALYVVRLKSDGTSADWAKAWGQDNTGDNLTAIAVHPTKDRIAIVGSTAKSAANLNFDMAQMPAPSGVAVNGIGFVAEIDSTSGVAQWIRGIIPDTTNPRSGSARMAGVSYDLNGDVVVAGDVNNGDDPDPGDAGVWFHDYPNTTKKITLDSLNSGEVVVVKYKPSNNGEVIWGDNVKMSAGSYNASRADGVVIDGMNRAYVAITYHNAVSFNGGGALPNLGGDENVGVLTVNPNGSVIAARGWGSDQFEWLNGIARDPWGNILLVGATQGAIDFGKGTTAHKAPGSTTFDSFVVKLDPNLDPLWSRQYGSIEVDQASKGAFGPAGQIGVVGYYGGTITFPDGTSQVAKGADDGYILGMSP